MIPQNHPRPSYSHSRSIVPIPSVTSSSFMSSPFSSSLIHPLTHSKFSPLTRHSFTPPAPTSSETGSGSLTPLESALPKNPPITPLQSALTKSPHFKSFRIRTYKNNRGGGVPSTSSPLSPPSLSHSSLFTSHDPLFFHILCLALVNPHRPRRGVPHGSVRTLPSPGPIHRFPFRAGAAPRRRALPGHSRRR